MLFEGIEVAVAMKQCKVFRDAEGGDQAINGFTDGDAAALQRVIVSGCANGKTRSGNIEDGQSQEGALGEPKAPLVTDSLQDFTENQVG